LLDNETTTKRMSFIEIEYSNGWFCNNDLLLVCHREMPINECLFTDEIHHHRRFVPQVNFNDQNLFPSLTKKKILFNDIDELNCLLDCKEYVHHRKQTISINQRSSTTKKRKRLSRFHD